MRIRVKGGGHTSQIYQGLIDAFEGKIGSAVEDAVPKKLKEALPELDSLLQSLPKEVPVTDIAQMNVTFIDEPALSESSLELEINGLLGNKDEVSVHHNHRRSLQSSPSCQGADKMVEISLHEDVLKSASSVYFEANKMQRVVDKIPDSSLMNTAGWRFIVPQLYKRYPNRDLNLNLSASSLPIIEVDNQQIKATIPLDVVIDVLDEEESIPVACISMVLVAYYQKHVDEQQKKEIKDILILWLTRGGASRRSLVDAVLVRGSRNHTVKVVVFAPKVPPMTCVLQNMQLVWSYFCLCYGAQMLNNDKANISTYGIGDGDQVMGKLGFGRKSMADSHLSEHMIEELKKRLLKKRVEESKGLERYFLSCGGVLTNVKCFFNATVVVVKLLV